MTENKANKEEMEVQQEESSGEEDQEKVPRRFQVSFAGNATAGTNTTSKSDDECGGDDEDEDEEEEDIIVVVEESPAADSPTTDSESRQRKKWHTKQRRRTTIRQAWGPVGSCLFWLQHKVPHLYFIYLQILVPLQILLSMAFLFGWMLAELEMEGEIQQNDDILKQVFSSYADHSRDILKIWDEMEKTSIQCLLNTTTSSPSFSYLESEILMGLVAEEEVEKIPGKNTSMNIVSMPKKDISNIKEDKFNIKEGITNYYNNNSENVTLLDGIQQCSIDRAREEFQIRGIYNFIGKEGIQSALTFRWMKCDWAIEGDKKIKFDQYMSDIGLNIHSHQDQQLLRYIFNFVNDFKKLTNKKGKYEEYNDDKINRLYEGNNKTLVEAIDESTGSDGCYVHVAGGALFWFTVMTTIGYGNAAPVTPEGRALVFTCGFVTIIAFLALNNTASNVWKDMFEDLFLRTKFGERYLISGPICVLFWLTMTSMWLIVIAMSAQAFWSKEVDNEFNFGDAYWFSYITTTTVGLGDYAIVHEEFEWYHMYFVPLVILIGFNFLGIFAEKLIELKTLYMPQQKAFREILEERRRSRRELAN